MALGDQGLSAGVAHVEEHQSCMELLRSQNEILERQNVLLVQICAFITPVSAFFAALKNFVIFMAWIVGLTAAAVAVWRDFIGWLISWVKGH